MLLSSGVFLFTFFITKLPFGDAFAVALFTASQALPTAPTPAPPPSGLMLSSQSGPPVSSMTTSLPFDAELVRKRQASLFSTDCAYFDDVAFTCPTSQYCAYNHIEWAVGCCSLDSSGNSLVSNCVVATQCLNQAQSSLYCAGSGCAADTTVCGVDTNYPDCATYDIYGATSIYTIFSCVTRALGSLSLEETVTSYVNPIPPATSSSKNSCPSSCQCKSSTTT